MAKKDYIDTLKTGIDFVGKMAAKSVSSISKGIRGEDKDEKESRITGLFFQKHIAPTFGEFLPRVEYYESVIHNHLMGSFVRNLVRSSADRSFVNACFALIFGDMDMALEKLNEAITSDPQYTDCYFLQGALYLQQKKYLKAEESFAKCRLIPTSLGDKLKKFLPTFKLTLCITDNISFSFFPDILGLNLLLAISQRNAGKLPQSIATLEQIISVMPENPELVFFLAAIYYEACWDDKIVDLLKDLAPNDNLQVLTVQFLVESFYNKKSYSLAEGILQKSMEAEGIDPYIVGDLKMLLGKVAKKLGRNAEGSAYIKKVKNLYPNYMDLNQRLGLKRHSKAVSKHAVPDIPMPESLTVEIGKQAEPVTPGARTVLTLPNQLPREIAGEEPGGIRLKSRDGKVSMILTDSITVGREAGDIVLNWDASASRIHARIFFDRGQIWVEDMGSTNGTWLNQHRITDKRAFNKGDNLLIGKTEFYLE